MLQEDEGHIKWVGGDTTVVQLGDVLDRGDSEIGAWQVALLRGCLCQGVLGPYWPQAVC